MSDLNQPTGWDDPRPEEPEWTPARGMLHAASRGMIVAVVLIFLLLPVAKYAPLVLNSLWIQFALGFGLAWVLLGVVQNASGMVGWPCTGLGCGLALLVIVVIRVAFVLFNLPTAASTIQAGAGAALSTLFCFPIFAGMIFAAVLCHNGSPGLGFLTDLLMSNPLFPGGRR